MWTCVVALVRKAPGAAETVVAPVSCGLSDSCLIKSFLIRHEVYPQRSMIVRSFLLNLINFFTNTHIWLSAASCHIQSPLAWMSFFIMYTKWEESEVCLASNSVSTLHANLAKSLKSSIRDSG